MSGRLEPGAARGTDAGPAVPALEARGLTVAYDGTRVLDELELVVAPGETVVVLGPSGSGKTTLLYAVAGFVDVSAGELRIAGKIVSGPRVSVPPERRDVAVVFQHYALWPHLSAAETVAYPLRRRGVPAADAARRAAELLALMGVEQLAGRRPAQLSGGEQQRVGVARALAREASLVLLDEPTAHLDTPLRASLSAELAEQRRRSGAAALYATHDVTEALAIADRVALLRDGRLVQVAGPREIYEQPLDLWAARLSGPASLLEAQRVGPGHVELGGHRVLLPLPAQGGGSDGCVTLLVRPDWAGLGGDLPGRIAAVWFRGPHTDYRLETPAGSLDLREAGPPRGAVGDAVTWTLHRAWPLASA